MCRLLPSRARNQKETTQVELSRVEIITYRCRYKTYMIGDATWTGIGLYYVKRLNVRADIHQLASMCVCVCNRSSPRRVPGWMHVHGPVWVRFMFNHLAPIWPLLTPFACLPECQVHRFVLGSSYLKRRELTGVGRNGVGGGETAFE